MDSLTSNYLNINKQSTTITQDISSINSQEEKKIDKEILIETVTYKEFIENLIPNVGTELIYFFIQMIETHFIGQKGNNELLDAIGLAQSYNMILVFYVGLGIIDVMDTICSRSFGKKEFNQLGNQTNQIRFILTTIFSFLSTINFFWADKILGFMVNNPTYIYDTHLYIKIVTPSIFLSLHYETFCRYFEVQLVYKPVVVSLLLALFVHPIICWLFISYLNMGIVGAGICSNITEFLRFMIVFIYAKWFNPYPKSNICPSKEIFNSKFSNVLKLSTFSAGLFIGESGGYNLVEFITARMGTTIFAQHVTLVNITYLTFSFSSGFLGTNGILIGNYAGMNSPINVKKIIKISTILSLVVFIPIMILISIFATQVLFFFSESPEIWKIDGMAELVYLSCINNFFDFQQGNIQGMLRGLGIINLTFYATFISYFLVLPFLCYMIAIYWDLKLKGVWISLLIINIMVFIFNLIILSRIDINKICEEYEDEDDEEEEEDEDEDEVKEKKF